MASNDKEAKLVLEDSCQLHPETCGSSIRWSVIAKEVRHDNKKKGTVSWTRDMDCTVHLTDCAKQITWSASSYDGGPNVMIEKLDKAIATLRDMRRYVKVGQRFYNGLRHGDDDES